jgi:uncharacterized membrane protein SirB2
LEKAEELFQAHLVYTTIICVIIFIALITALDNASNGIQWSCLIIFFTVVFVVLAKIQNNYKRDKEDVYKQRMG